MFRQRPSVGDSKQVCSFYLKGTCKYGSRCWNLHPPNQGGTGMANAFGGGGSNVFGGKANTQQDSKEFQDFVKQVSGEMNQWERSGQWLLSCFAPLKAHPLIPGFSDFSPEELRVQAYKALKSNTSNTYQAHWNELQQRYKQLREALKISTQDAVQAMREVYHAKSNMPPEQESQQSKQTTLFGKPSGLPVFGGATTQPVSSAGLLGPKPQPSVFGGTPVFHGSQPTAPSLFGGMANKSVFGGQSTLGTQSTNVFGNQTSTVFGGTSSNVFKNGAQSTPNNSLFGGTSQGQANASSVFGGNNSASTTNQTTSTIFGGQNKSTAANIFNSNSQNQTSVFGGTGNKQGNGFQGTQGTAGSSSTGGGQGSIFGNQQPGLYGIQKTQQQQAGSVFGAPSTFGTSPSTQVSSTPVQKAAPSVFGGTSCSSPFGGTTVQSTGSIFGGNGSATSGGGSGPFGNMQASGPFSKPLSGVFGNNNEPNTNTGLFGKQAEALQSSTVHNVPGMLTQHAEGISNPGGSFAHRENNAEWYTPLDQLQPADRAQFEAEAFSSIPLCAPPVELCV